MRSWFLTNTTYGSWLPGDPRGSVTSVRDHRAGDPLAIVRFEHDLPGEPWEEPMTGLYHAAIEQMNGPPIYLDGRKAELVLAQLQETASYRSWNLHAVAIMYNHFHVIVHVNDDPSPTKILADFKAYATRKLNKHYGRPPSETWWTNNGSKRKLKDEIAITDATTYVLYKQPNPLVVWSATLGRLI